MSAICGGTAGAGNGAVACQTANCSGGRVTPTPPASSVVSVSDPEPPGMYESKIRRNFAPVCRPVGTRELSVAVRELFSATKYSICSPRSMREKAKKSRSVVGRMIMAPVRSAGLSRAQAAELSEELIKRM